jgi:hypothetical protein
MAEELTLDAYILRLTEKIKNLEATLSDLKKVRTLFIEHPELFGEFKRINMQY